MASFHRTHDHAELALQQALRDLSIDPSELRWHALVREVVKPAMRLSLSGFEVGPDGESLRRVAEKHRLEQ